METIVKELLNRKAELNRQYESLKTRPSDTPRNKQALVMDLKNLFKKMKANANRLYELTHCKIIVVTVFNHTKGIAIKRILTNISKEGFYSLCPDGKYFGFDILDVEEVDPKTYQEEVNEKSL